MTGQCTIEGCGSPTKAKGYCTRHYTRFIRYGDPLVVLRQPREGCCTVDGCPEPIQSKRLCGRHYQRAALNGGDPGPASRERRKRQKRCEQPGCRNPHVARGCCERHYDSLTKYGDPAEVDRRRLTTWLPCSVDGCDSPSTTRGLHLRPGVAAGMCSSHARRTRLYGAPNGQPKPRTTKGHVNSNGYLVRSVGGRVVLEHRRVMEQVIGRPLLPTENVHHKNGVRTDNRPENLELWVKKQCPGARATDLVPWARQIIATYGDLVDQRIIT